MPDSTVSRRDFLRRASLLGVVAASGSTLLSACGGGDAPAEGGAAAGGAEYPVVDASTCQGYDALTETDRNARQGLGYVDASPEAGKYCGNCILKKAYDQDTNCIGCQLFQGPVSPGGWCNSYAPMAT